MNASHSQIGAPVRGSGFDLYRVLLALLILGYLALFARLAFDQHAGMRTHKADLGQIDQAVWNSSRGRFVAMTDNGFEATRMTDHVEPILALVSPIFWLWDDVRALLLLQAIFVAVGAWFVFALALHQFDTALAPKQRGQIWQLEPMRQLTRPLALVLAIAYLLTPQLQSALLTEFHAAPLAVPLILWAFWAVAARRWIQFALAVLLVAGVKEEMALLAAGLGLWAMWRMIVESRAEAERISWPAFALASGVMLISLAWFYVATFVIVPAHAADVYGVAESGYFQRYGALGDSPVDILTNLIFRPDLVWQIMVEPARFDYLLGLLAPFGFLSLLAPEILLLALPLLLANVLSAYPAQYYGEFHYSAPLIAYVAASAAYGSARLWRWVCRRTESTSANFQQMPVAGMATMATVSAAQNSRTAVRPLAAFLIGAWIVGWAVTSYLHVGRGPLAARYDPTPITAHHRLLSRFTQQLPADAAVTATAAVHPHVSHRRYVYQFPLGVEEPDSADWALLDVTTNTDMAPGDLKGRVEQMLSGEWGIVDAADGFLLLRKGEPNKEIPDEFYSFARISAEDHVVEEAGEGQPLRFLGLQVDDWPRWRQTKLTSSWQVGEGFDPTVDRPRLEVRTPNGETVYTFSDANPVGFLWYPPERWQAGDIISATTASLYLPRVWGVAASHVGPADADGLRPVEVDGELTLVDARYRIEDDELAAIPPSLFTSPEMAEQLALSTGLDHQRIDTTFQLDNEFVRVSAWASQKTTPAGEPIDLWLQWEDVTAWPETMSSFVHLREENNLVDQIDGRPRFFVRYDEPDVWETGGMAGDWRQLVAPDGDGREPQEMRVVVGLYSQATGERVPVLDEGGALLGNEMEVARFTVGPPLVPDQTCALIPATCASQPLP